MLILRYSDTEYLIHSPAEKDGIYYRGYLIEIGGKRYVQLVVLGLEEAPVPDDEDELFHVAAYDLKQGILEVSLLNSKLVNAQLEDAVALRKSFMEHLDDATLFKPHQRYRRCAGEHEDSSQ